MIQQKKEFEDRVRYRSTNLQYHIKRSKRIKTSELIVDSDRIEIRTPLNKSLKDTRNIILDKADWILKKQKQCQETVQEIIIPSFEENSTLPYLGKNYHLTIKNNQPTNTIRFVDGQFIINIMASNINEESKLKIRELYEDWLIRMAQKILKKRVEIYGEKVGVEVDARKISVKSILKSRWASLTKKNSINFSMNLIKAPQDVIDYIVLHELCHLKIKGHSHHYWNLVYRYIPDYQDKIDWLSVNGRFLVND